MSFNEIDEFLYRALVRAVLNAPPDRRAGPSQLLKIAQTICDVDQQIHDRIIEQERQIRVQYDVRVMVVEGKHLRAIENPTCWIHIGRGRTRSTSSSPIAINSPRYSVTDQTIQMIDAETSPDYQNFSDPVWNEQFDLSVVDYRQDSLKVHLLSTPTVALTDKINTSNVDSDDDSNDSLKEIPINKKSPTGLQRQHALRKSTELGNSSTHLSVPNDHQKIQPIVKRKYSIREALKTILVAQKREVSASELIGTCEPISMKDLSVGAWVDVWKEIKRQKSHHGHHTQSHGRKPETIHLKLRLMQRKSGSSHADNMDVCITLDGMEKILKLVHLHCARAEMEQISNSKGEYSAELYNHGIGYQVLIEQFALSNGFSWLTVSSMHLKLMLEWDMERTAAIRLSPNVIHNALERFELYLQSTPMTPLEENSENIFDNELDRLGEAVKKFLSDQFWSWKLSDMPSVFPPGKQGDLLISAPRLDFMYHLATLPCWYKSNGQNIADEFTNSTILLIQEDASTWFQVKTREFGRIDNLLDQARYIVKALTELEQNLANNATNFMKFYANFNIDYLTHGLEAIDAKLSKIAESVMQNLGLMQKDINATSETIREITTLTAEIHCSFKALKELFIKLQKEKFTGQLDNKTELDRAGLHNVKNAVKMKIFTYENWLSKDILAFWLDHSASTNQQTVLNSVINAIKTHKSYMFQPANDVSNISEGSILVLRLLKNGIVTDWEDLGLKNPKNICVGTIKLTQFPLNSESRYSKTTVLQSARSTGRDRLTAPCQHKHSANTRAIHSFKSFCDNIIGYSRYLYRLILRKRYDITKLSMAANSIEYLGKYTTESLPKILNFEEMFTILAENFPTETNIAQANKMCLQKMIEKAATECAEMAAELCRLLVMQKINTEILKHVQEATATMSNEFIHSMRKHWNSLMNGNEGACTLIYFLRRALIAMHGNMSESLYPVVTEEIFKQTIDKIDGHIIAGQPAKYYANVLVFITEIGRYFDSTRVICCKEHEKFMSLVSCLEMKSLSTDDLGLRYYESLADKTEIIETPSTNATILIQLGKIQMTGGEVRLIVKVLSGMNMPPLDANGTCDPFVELELLPKSIFHQKIKQKTTVKANDLHPVYNEAFSFYVNESDALTYGCVLSMVVWDYDYLSRNDLAGEVILHLSMFQSVEMEQLVDHLTVHQCVIRQPCECLEGPYQILKERSSFDKDAQSLCNYRDWLVYRRFAADPMRSAERTWLNKLKTVFLGKSDDDDENDDYVMDVV